MPELPEVETIKIGLFQKIVGLKIKKIQILSAKSFIGNPNIVEGKVVLNVWRKAKILGIDLTPVISSEARNLSRMRGSNKLRDSSAMPQNDNSVTLLFHLKMTGQLIYESQVTRIKSQRKRNLDSRLSTLDSRFIGGHPTPDMRDVMPNSHTRVIFSFSDGSHLYFNDQRRFGWIRIVNSRQVTVDSSLKNLGPEPLEKEFTWQILKESLLKRKNLAVKVVLMDQSVVSGVGNIYANEACFIAKIDPRLKVKDLTDKQIQALHKGLIKALNDGIKYGGASRAHFVDSKGHKGYFLDYAYVYGLNNHPCRICKTDIKKIQLAGRGTYLCPNCQKSI